MAAKRKTPAPPARPVAKRGARPAPRGAEPEKLNRRARLFRRIMRVRMLRGFYARRLLRYLDKAKAKNRVIPDQLADLDDYLGRVPAKQRRSVLEASLSGELEQSIGRDLRRAAGRQNRQKGRAGGGQRPGMPPVPGARPKPQ
jgi:hypothetical protein